MIMKYIVHVKYRYSCQILMELQSPQQIIEKIFKYQV